MQSSNQGWAAFDKDNTFDLVYRIPFADFGALIDPPSEDVTAHVIEMLARTGYTSADRKVAEGLAYLRRTQQPDGSWFGRWGVNYIYGTWCVISALYALYGSGDRLPSHAWRAIRWLLSRQNADGGWGETCHSYVDTSFAGVGTSITVANRLGRHVVAIRWTGSRGSLCTRAEFLAESPDKRDVG